MSRAANGRTGSTASSSGSTTDLSQSSTSLPGQPESPVRRVACAPTPSFRFHSYTGRNVSLIDSGLVAVRQRSFSGLVFSERSLNPAEVFTVEVEAVEPGWSGSLRVGLTNLDPNASPPLPAHPIPDLTSGGRAWMTSVTLSGGVSARQDCNHLRSFAAEEIPVGAVGCTVSVYYTLDCVDSPSNGRFTVWIAVNDLPTVSIRAHIPPSETGPQLYAVFDIFGETKAIRALTPYKSPVRLKTLCREAIVRALGQCAGDAAQLQQQYEQRSPLGLPQALQQFVLVDHF